MLMHHYFRCGVKIPLRFFFFFGMNKIAQFFISNQTYKEYQRNNVLDS